MASYPSQKQGNPYMMEGKVTHVKDSLITYELDASPGCSGSPLFVFLPYTEIAENFNEEKDRPRKMYMK